MRDTSEEGVLVSWSDDLGLHEGFVVCVFLDGRLGGGSELGGIPVYGADGMSRLDAQGRAVELRPPAAVVGWRVACNHAPSYVGDDRLATWSGKHEFWVSDKLWQRVYSPAEEDLGAGRIAVPLDGGTTDVWVEARDDVLDSVVEEWERHVIPGEHERSIRRSLAAVRDATRMVDLEVAAARAAGMSWADIGKAAGMSRQAAHERWGPTGPAGSLNGGPAYDRR